MASPHAAGAAAKYLQRNPSHTPSQVQTALRNETIKGIITGTSTNNPVRLVKDRALPSERIS